jgi:hypothetical protein
MKKDRDKYRTASKIFEEEAITYELMMNNSTNNTAEAI